MAHPWLFKVCVDTKTDLSASQNMKIDGSLEDEIKNIQNFLDLLNLTNWDSSYCAVIVKDLDDLSVDFK